MDHSLLELLFVNQVKEKKPAIIEEQKRKKPNLLFSNSKAIKPCLAARYLYFQNK